MNKRTNSADEINKRIEFSREEAIQRNADMRAVTNLKPCPFCGSEPVLYETDTDKWVIMCDNDDCLVEVFVQYDRSGGMEEAVRAWNTRIITRQIPELDLCDDCRQKAIDTLAGELVD